MEVLDSNEKNTFDVFVYDLSGYHCVLVKSFADLDKAIKFSYSLEKKGLITAVGVRPDKILDGKCVYDEN